MRLTHRLIQSVTPAIPAAVRAAIRARISLSDFDIACRRAANPFAGQSERTYPGSRFRMGIVEDVAQYHKYHIAACQEAGVSYRVMNLLADGWLRQFRSSGCDAFLVWPSSETTVAKHTFDYRLRILQDDLGQTLFPTWRECWLTEHKPRLRDWLEAHDLPHPRTNVFHDRGEALEFAETAALPIVSKTATGASASGVRVIRTRPQLRRLIRDAFGRGLCPRGYDPRDRQRGCVYLQEYLPGVEEWRMVRIGESYFGYRKERGPSGLHSASHTWSWLDPGPPLLDLLKRVTDAGDFASMDVDVFRQPEGTLLINECQTVFGCSTPAVQMQVDGVDGRYLREDGRWRFEAGEFCRNHMCNLRLEYLCQRLAAGGAAGR